VRSRRRVEDCSARSVELQLASCDDAAVLIHSIGWWAMAGGSRPASSEECMTDAHDRISEVSILRILRALYLDASQSPHSIRGSRSVNQSAPRQSEHGRGLPGLRCLFRKQARPTQPPTGLRPPSHPCRHAAHCHRCRPAPRRARAAGHRPGAIRVNGRPSHRSSQAMRGGGRPGGAGCWRGVLTGTGPTAVASPL